MNLVNDQKFAKTEHDYKLESLTKPKSPLFLSRKHSRDRCYLY